MTVQRGYDPRESVMVAYGGAGPLHAVAIARELNIKTVLIPPYCGIFSAVGMLLADAKDEYVLSHIEPFDEGAAAELNRLFLRIEAEGLPVMQRAGFEAHRIVMKRALEMRYIGQEFSLLVDCPHDALTHESVGQIRARFNTIYAARYGHAFPDLLPEVASLRLHVYGLFQKPEINLGTEATTGRTAHPCGRRAVYFEETGFVDCAVYRRAELAANIDIKGPAIVEEHSSTTVVSPLDSVRCDDFGNLVISIGA